MSRRTVQVMVALGVLDAGVLALTIHSHVTYHRSNAQAPLVMPLGQLLGWIISGALFLAIVVIATDPYRSRRAGRYRSGAAARGRRPGRGGEGPAQ